MNELIKRYIELLFSEGNKNKRDIIINLGLILIRKILQIMYNYFLQIYWLLIYPKKKKIIY